MAEKSNKSQTQTLDSRIAHALKNGEATDRDTLAELNNLAVDEIEQLEATIIAEEPRLLDISNPEPDKSQTTITSAKLRIERLTKAILQELHPRIDQLDLQARQSKWTKEANVLRDASDDLYWELQQVYKPLVAQLNELFVKARAITAAFNQLLQRAPPGVARGFGEVMPYDDFWLRLALPSWDDPTVTYPTRVKEPDPLVEISLASAAFAKAFDAKTVMTAAQQNARDDEAEAKLKAKAVADRERYHQALLEAERRRVTGG